MIDPGVRAQVLFHDPIGDKGPHDGEQDGGRRQEVPVAGGVQDHVDSGCDQGLVGDAGEQRIRGANQQIGRKTAGNSGKGGCHTGQGMPTRHGENHCADGDYDDIACVRSNVGHDTGKNHNGCEETGIGVHQQFLQGGVEQTGPFGHAYPQHGN